MKHSPFSQLIYCDWWFVFMCPTPAPNERLAGTPNIGSRRGFRAGRLNKKLPRSNRFHKHNTA